MLSQQCSSVHRGAVSAAKQDSALPLKLKLLFPEETMEGLEELGAAVAGGASTVTVAIFTLGLSRPSRFHGEIQLSDLTYSSGGLHIHHTAICLFLMFH